MVARSDGEQYGKMLTFQFPKQQLIFGPSQIVNRINQDQVISPQLTLWNQQGSEVIQGTLLVIPIEEALLYIRPMYLRASGGRIPELKQVVVAYQNQIVMDETFDRALDRLFGRGTPGDPIAPPSTLMTDVAPTAPEASRADTAATQSAPSTTLAQQAQGRYSRALQALREGDWKTAWARKIEVSPPGRDGYDVGPFQARYRPTNYDYVYEGPITLRRAFEHRGTFQPSG